MKFLKPELEAEHRIWSGFLFFFAGICLGIPVALNMSPRIIGSLFVVSAIFVFLSVYFINRCQAKNYKLYQDGYRPETTREWFRRNLKLDDNWQSPKIISHEIHNPRTHLEYPQRTLS